MDMPAPAPVSKDEIVRRAQLVESVYDSVEPGQDNYENKYKGYPVFRKSQLLQKVGLISQSRTHKITRYLYMTVKTPWFGSSVNWSGYIATDVSVETKQLNIVVVFRGTMTTAEWWKDLSATLTQFSFVREECMVHSGFNSLYSSKDPEKDFGDKSLRDQVIDELTRILAANPQYKRVRITIAGHSLGGALAALAACDIGKNFALKKNIPVSAFTFGSPRVGADSFKKIVEKHAAIQRFENVGDVVPLLPPKFLGYVAVGKTQTVDYTTSPYVKTLYFWDISKKHDLELSMHGILLEPGVVSLDKIFKEMAISTSSSMEYLSKELTKDGDQTTIDQLKSVKSLFSDEEGNEDTTSLRLYLLECVYVSRSQKHRQGQQDPDPPHPVDYAKVNKRQDSLKSKWEVPPYWWAHSNNNVQQYPTTGDNWQPRSKRPEDNPIPSNPEYN